ncbi:hypothetical protein [uncultured Pseudodesulfovibrio sp.]|uniref:hypothetical protein n=1 Tax=uncultured Pseudodesulfovibrio sp. TaxID=2035858 RepID=UPI0029C69D02|nr:hypothetical protein [uncultured Pseudodesulfovibrio sp.]
MTWIKMEEIPAHCAKKNVTDWPDSDLGEFVNRLLDSSDNVLVIFDKDGERYVFNGPKPPQTDA